jgi:two-component system sensor histidine kinase PilS (NtrC family)
MFARIVFTLLILASTIYVQFQTKDDSDNSAVVLIYYLVAFIFALSLFYAVISRQVTRQALFSYVQFAVDAFIITLIVYITGGYYSFFSFLYLVVIIYASMILYMKGGLFVATLNSVLYAILLVLEISATLPDNNYTTEAGIQELSWPSVIYKILIITGACFGVALLSGFLTEQNRRSQKELRTMEDHLKRVEKMAYMGEMAAGLAHEIKNPLASLAGSIQLLKEDLRYAPDHERLMDIILRETDRLNVLVSDFLFFSKPPSGKSETVELGKAISEITDLFQRDSINSKNIQLKKTLSDDCWVAIDPSHLSQIIWNLLLNAADAIGDEGDIHIECENTRSKVVEIKVRDNGCGMEPDVARFIFDPFFTTKSDGTGLGLSITHRILEAYNSRLEVQSVPAKGTTFAFNLEMVKPPG